jgi:tetratricopeptide (TPR) repeat protein
LSKASQLRQKAQNFLKKGRLDKAIEEYQRLIQVESRNPNLYNELGDLYLKAGDRVQAVSSFEKASVNYEKVALYNNAVAVCKKILRVVPNRLDTIFKLGELKVKQKFEGEAASYFSQFLKGVIADIPGAQEGLQRKLNLMIEFVPDREELVSAAADVYRQLGFKVKAAQLLTDLVSRLEERGESTRAESYQGTINSLKSSLSSEELSELDERLSVAGDAGTDRVDEVDSTVEEVLETSGRLGAVEPDDVDAHPGVGEDTASVPVSAEPGFPTAERDGVVSTGVSSGGSADESDTGGTGSASTTDADAVSQQSRDRIVSSGGTGSYEERESAETAGHIMQEVALEEPSPEAGEGAAGSEETAVEEDAEPVDERSTEPGDGAASGDVIDFAHEITSDVEEDDYKSHYDLGMAYIEMALFDEAVKELQIASRSEQLYFKSIEMIGHCFLMQNNPRLAVKQLQRGLLKAKDAGVESLGIHYNLGLAYEMLDEREKAGEHFDEVYIVDVTFRDIAEKMKNYSEMP